MAAKRISKSAINWAAFSERVPEAQRQQFQVFKAKSDGYLRRVFQYPENPPPIDFAMYRSGIGNPALVDQMEKAYKSFVVPFPKEHLTPLIDAQEREAKEDIANFIADSKQRIEDYKQEFAHFEAIIPAAHMTMEDYAKYYPQHAINLDKPTYWPHDGSAEQGEAEAAAEGEQAHH
uniref:ATP synthase subunit d, mitochondrial n=1 Tax=Ornithodoros parkeri TaxID=140564 RepID=A6N9V9_ORNPR|nr:ATP synthase D chain [Ornithodoros parkeri]